mgnify:CR=1 FL=1
MRRDICIDGSRSFQQLAAVVRAVADNLRADMRHAQREILPHGEQGRLFFAVAQNARFMLVQTVVFLEIACVVGPHLAQGGIEEPAACRRARADEHQILRAKQHGFEQSLCVRLAFLPHTVFVDFHRLGARSRSSSEISRILREKIRKDESMILSEPQPLFFLGRAEQPHGRAGRCRFEQVGFALSVFAADQVDRRIERKRFVRVVAEILQF